jgi:PPK2 family polyphosphate:nucleotide phosphotransferase
MTGLRKLLSVQPGRFRLADVDPRSTPGLPKDKAVEKDPKQWSREQVTAIGADLASYQERLFASAKLKATERRVLLLLQAMDCGGKDGTVRNVVKGMNPVGIKAVSFGPPDDEERRHDFLWRIRRALPPAGHLGVFNRSHYEDVLVVRVHQLVPEEVWSQRYDAINTFEQQEAESGLTMVKVMLHISKKEQKSRLLDRLDDPTKRWKYNPGDLEERARWDEYQQAYEDALNRCSTETNPWYVVPADRKWYRNWAVTNILVEQLEAMALRWPPAPPGLDIEAQRARLLSMP